MNKRIILTFGKQCNMNCPFCYGYFDGKYIELNTIFKILTIIEHHGINKISIAGGDPLAYQEVDKVILYAKKLGMSVDLDTNCYSFSYSKHIDMLENVDYLGIPIDGHISIIHDKIRNRSGSFEKVLNVLNKVTCDVSINTLITKENYRDLNEIYRLLSKYSVIKQWHIYELLPILVNAAYFTDNHIEYSIYSENVNSFKDGDNNIKIFCKSKSERIFSHMFVSTSGEVYCNDYDDELDYKKFGSIFCHDNLRNMIKYACEEKSDE